MAEEHMEKRVTNSAVETKKLGKLLGESLHGGDIIALYGDLGSGKTTFVQGVAEGLGIPRRIVSPTFLIVKTYSVINKKANIDIFYHADLYRIESPKDMESIGILEMIHRNNAVTVIEWPEKIEHLLPKSVKKISFTYISEDKRSITYE